MTRREPLWQQGGVYPALTDRALLTALWPNGGAFGGKASTINNTMQVSIPPGSCAVPLQSGQGTALCTWDAAELVALADAPASGQFRWDWIVCQVRDAAVDGGANNDFVFVPVSSAVAAPYPPRPTLPQNAYGMFEIGVNGGIANLNGITPGDLRGLLAPASPRPRCRAYRNAAFTVGTGAGNWIQFDNSVEDSWGMLSSFGYPGEIILPFAGRWLITGQVSVNPGAGGNAMNVQLSYRRGATLYGILTSQTHPQSTWGLTGNIGPISITAQTSDSIHVNASMSNANANGQTGLLSTAIAVDYLGP